MCDIKWTSKHVNVAQYVQDSQGFSKKKLKLVYVV